MISNNKEPGGCLTPTCKLVLHQGSRLTLKAKPANGYIFRRWLGPCLSRQGPKCLIKGSKRKEHFVAVFGIRISSALSGGGSITMEMRRTGPQTVLIQTIQMNDVPAVCEPSDSLTGPPSYATVLSSSNVVKWRFPYTEAFSGNFSVGDPIFPGGQTDILAAVHKHRIGGTAGITVALQDANNTTCSAWDLGWDAFLPR